MNIKAKNEILTTINNINLKKIKDADISAWNAVKYLRGYDAIENTNIKEKEITSESLLNSPWLSLNYFDPVVDINEDIIVPFYVTNYNHDEWMNDDYTTMFQIEIVFNGVIIRKIAHAGNNEINIGKCPKYGEHYFTYQCTDLSNNIKSPMYTKHLLCKDKSKILNIYEMTEEDLITYNINNTNNRELTVMENNIDGLNSFINDKKSEGYDGVKLLPGQYNVAPGNTRNRPITVPSNFILDMNGSKIKHVFTTKGSTSLIIKISMDAIDSHIINGYIEGDYDEHDVTVVGDEAAAGSGIEGEGFYCITMGGAFCSLENVDIGWVTGYCACPGENSEYITNAQNTASFTTCYINSKGEEIVNTNFYTSDFYDISSIKNNNYKFITACNYRGYGGYVGDSEIGYIHFYDSNKVYLKSTKFRQYSLIPILENSVYVKVTLYSTSTPSSNTFRVQGRNYIDMSNYKLLNVDFHDTRTCALATGIYDFQLVKNCTFNGCGQWLPVGRVTPVAIDIEDGYQWGQNYFFENNFVNTEQSIGSNKVIINHGYNVNIKNTNMTGEYRYVKGLNFKDSEIRGVTIITLVNKIKTGFHRLYNNIFTDELGYVIQDETMLTKIKKCTFLNKLNNGTGYTPTNGKNIICENCLFDSSRAIGGSTIINSTIKNSSNIGINAIIYNSKIINVKSIASSPHIYNGIIDNCTFNQEGHIFDSTIINSQINYGYWDKGHTFEINNSKITLNNNLSLFRVPNYSLNYPLTINGNNILLNDNSNIIGFYDDRTNSSSDYSAKYITIKNNNITKNSKNLITGIGTNNIIKIKYINNNIKDTEGNVFTPVEEIHDNVEITVE